VDVKCQGPGCGKTFETQSAKAKYCSSTCRSRGNRAGVGFPAPPAPDESDGGLVAATRRELEAAEVLDTVLGQQALTLARRILSPASTGASVASLSKELRVVMSEATAGLKVADDPLDELRARRDRKRTG
jgi:hypothetical protein